MARIPLAATVLPGEVACAIELSISSLPADLGQPVPGLTGAEVAQARGGNRGRRSPGGTAERRLDLAQACRPVPVVFRRQPASVPWQAWHHSPMPEAMACRFNTTSLSVTNTHELDAKYPICTLRVIGGQADKGVPNR